MPKTKEVTDSGACMQRVSRADAMMASLRRPHLHRHGSPRASTRQYGGGVSVSSHG
jgi:hypothetical protein